MTFILTWSQTAPPRSIEPGTYVGTPTWSDEMKFSKQLANPSRFSDVLFFKIPNPLLPPASSPSDFSCFYPPRLLTSYYQVFMEPASSHWLLGTPAHFPYVWEIPSLCIFFGGRQNLLLLLFYRSWLCLVVCFKFLQENIGSGHLRHLNTELETVKQGSKASRNPGG